MLVRPYAYGRIVSGAYFLCATASSRLDASSVRYDRQDTNGRNHVIYEFWIVLTDRIVLPAASFALYKLVTDYTAWFISACEPALSSVSTQCTSASLFASLPLCRLPWPVC